MWCRGTSWASVLVALVVAFACIVRPIHALEKTGMPDLAQVEQTCLPTSTANLIIWFGNHGYPKLIPAGETVDDRDLNAVHRLMVATDARFDWGTRMRNVTVGIEKYIHESGYAADVRYRGVGNHDEAAFSLDWLKENDASNEGFILVLAYCQLNPRTHTVTLVPIGGHAVTLVNMLDDVLLVHDPAHLEDETGRKILTPHVIPARAAHDGDADSPEQLTFLTGSLLRAPPGCGVVMLGAVCITMHAANEPGNSSSNIAKDSAAAESRLVAAPASAPPAPLPWWSRLYQAVF